MSSLTLEESKTKSSRSKADFFELLVALGLSEYYKLKDREILEKYLKILENEISKFKNGKRRTDEQKKRAEIIVPELVKEINKSLVPKYNNLTQVRWVGRGWQKNESLSDVDLEFESGKLIGISLKSTRGGKGTQKNIGAGTLKEYLGLEVDDEVAWMWSKVREDMRKEGGEVAKLANEGTTKIRSNKYEHLVIQEIGRKWGRMVQRKAVNKNVELFNNLSLKKQIKFLEFIFGVDKTIPLLNATVEKDKVFLYWNREIDKILKGDLRAKQGDSDKGYNIFAGDTSIIRIQVNFTNGMGLSAFCERAFLEKNFTEVIS